MVNRKNIWKKYNGLCAYTGKPLGDDWQIDHVIPKYRLESADAPDALSIEHEDNLLPALRIVNHYKRAKGLEGFRRYMMTFHLRLAKLPKNPTATATVRHKRYLLEVADAFGISVEQPFDGKFYFEKVGNSNDTI